ncbi:MAG: aldo/keto reductase [Nitrospiraceae bacterium]
MSAHGAARPSNRLATETSPYLLQHAQNPVDWYPWGPEALQRARELHRPILLSIGYSACHWCHVMERESFEDDRIAALMNEHFICIKVDREERPDLDEIYMQATLALNQGQGGWPMTVFLTPDQAPIFAGTYFPPTDRYGRPGFPTVLQKVAEFWRTDPDGLRRQAAQVTERLKEEMRVTTPMSVGEAELDAAVTQLAEDFDSRFGGFGHAPKFPPATGLSFLLRRHHRTGDAQTLYMVKKTLDAMAAGGMYDHIGGGFARYSTDERWLVPHFEKMLYDNALLSRTYLEAYQATGEADYRRVAGETLEYILREMTSPDGGFYSATDADSEGVEGKFFVWTPDDIRAIAPTEDDARRLCAYYDITPGGNWEQTSIPNTPRPLEEVARELTLSPDELRRTIERLRPVMYEARRRRVPPGLDDKILTAWNGMMITAMAEGARVLGDTRYLGAGERAADFLLLTMSRPDRGLYRTYRAGKAHLHACLEDYAFFAESLIDLYEAGAHEGYLHEAVRLAERMLADFQDTQHGGFFTTARDHEALIVRSREGPDGATPGGNAVAASALARLSFHYARDEFREAATGAIRAYGRQIARYPRAFTKSLIVTDLLLNGPVELALVGNPAEPGYEALKREVNRPYLPNRIMAHYDPQGPDPRHPLTMGKGPVGGKAALYICRNFTCQTPITEPAAAAAALANPRRDGEASAKALRSARLSGHATPGGTAAYAVRTIGSPSASPTAHGYTMFGSTGLTASRLGFGGYRIDMEDAAHREALVHALRNGCNLLDTSTNYTDGDSERLVGSVLAELIKKGEITRDAIIVVSKIGYVQGQNMTRAQAREKAGRPYPDMVKYAEGLWHCLHPEFIADQLELSLERLGLDTLDVCLLHNVEYFLSDAKHRGLTDVAGLRQEFDRRAQTAFEYLETQVAEGRLRYYGVSSNTCALPPDDPEATSVSRLLEAAQIASTAAAAASAAPLGSHHFKVLQCPMNLFESGALLTPNTGRDGNHTVLELAQTERLAVLVNRPLNAIPVKGEGMIRLADLPVEPSAVAFDIQRDLVSTLEDEYRRDFVPHIQKPGHGMPPEDYFRWADELTKVRPHIQNAEHWEQIENQMIAPHLNQVLRALTHHFTAEMSTRWEAWRDRYLTALLALLKELRREATIKSRRQTSAVAERLNPLLPDDKRHYPLSRKALWVLTSTPGVTCVLNGMRTPAYVSDSLEVLRWEPLPHARRVYEAVQSAPVL